MLILELFKHGTTAPFFKVLGIVNSVKLEQPLKTSKEIDVILPKSTLVSFVQFSKALCLISLIDSGITTLVILEAPLKALLPKDTTVFPSNVPGTVTLPDKAEALVQTKSVTCPASFNLYSKETEIPLRVEVAISVSEALTSVGYTSNATVQNNKTNKIFNVRDIFSSFVCIKH